MSEPVDDQQPPNLALWDERAAAHAASPDYGVRRFADDPTHLSDVVRFDRERLGDLTGLDVVHLQCHIGTDTVSLARLGARVTGLDFSPASIDEARRVAEGAGADVRFVVSDVHDAVEALDATYDLVYTGIGALCWVPRIARWAEVVSSLLRPGGRLHVREGHPVLWALDQDRTDGRLELVVPYFEHEEPTVWDEPGTYVDSDVDFVHTRSEEWNHGLGEIVTALLDVGLEVTGLAEHRSVPWKALPTMVDLGDGEFALPGDDLRAPMTYTLTARRPG